MAKIQDLEDAILAELSAQKASKGTGNLSATDMETVSRAVDAKNETWNGNLPPRPHA